MNTLLSELDVLQKLPKLLACRIRCKEQPLSMVLLIIIFILSVVLLIIIELMPLHDMAFRICIHEYIFVLADSMWKHSSMSLFHEINVQTMFNIKPRYASSAKTHLIPWEKASNS